MEPMIGSDQIPFHAMYVASPTHEGNQPFEDMVADAHQDPGHVAPNAPLAVNYTAFLESPDTKVIEAIHDIREKVEVLDRKVDGALRDMRVIKYNLAAVRAKDMEIPFYHDSLLGNDGGKLLVKVIQGLFLDGSVVIASQALVSANMPNHEIAENSLLSIYKEFIKTHTGDDMHFKRRDDGSYRLFVNA